VKAFAPGTSWAPMTPSCPAVEKQARNVAADERLALRQAQSAPVLAQIRQRLLLWKEQLLPKHPMAEAINYALSQWQEMNVFCSDGAVAIDHNDSEREMKRVILNRKNSLFVGNPRGGKTAAILAIRTSTCRRHDIDPQLYFTQLLTNLPATLRSDLPDWLPDKWKQRHNPATTAKTKPHNVLATCRSQPLTSPSLISRQNGLWTEGEIQHTRRREGGSSVPGIGQCPRSLKVPAMVGGNPV
jgi:hypothetical protein